MRDRKTNFRVYKPKKKELKNQHITNSRGQA